MFCQEIRGKVATLNSSLYLSRPAFYFCTDPSSPNSVSVLSSLADAAWHWLLFDVVLPHMVPADLETVAAVRAEVLRASWAALLATDGNQSTANAGITNASTTNAGTTNAGSGKPTSTSGSDGGKNKTSIGNSAESAKNAKGDRVFAFFADVFADMCGKDAEIAKMLSSVDIEVRILIGWRMADGVEPIKTKRCQQWQLLCSCSTTTKSNQNFGSIVGDAFLLFFSGQISTIVVLSTLNVKLHCCFSTACV